MEFAIGLNICTLVAVVFIINRKLTRLHSDTLLRNDLLTRIEERVDSLAAHIKEGSVSLDTDKVLDELSCVKAVVEVDNQVMKTSLEELGSKVEKIHLLNTPEVSADKVLDDISHVRAVLEVDNQEIKAHLTELAMKVDKLSISRDSQAAETSVA